MASSGFDDAWQASTPTARIARRIASSQPAFEPLSTAIGCRWPKALVWGQNGPVVGRGDEQLARAFPATRHSTLAAIRGDDPRQRRRGLEALAAAYWRP